MKNELLKLIVGALLFVMGAGCADDVQPVAWPTYEPPVTPSDPLPEDPQPSLFSGRWVVSQPAHAGYEATLYHFQEDGTLVEEQSIQQGSGRVPTGRVAECLEQRENQCVEWGTECVFHQKWRSEEQSLFVYSECSDGESKEVRLDFEDLTQDFLFPEVSVDGQTNWEHNDFQWAWTRCDTAQDCVCALALECPDQ